MLDGYKAFQLFTAIRLHFTNPKYDVFTTKGRVRGSRETFEKRRDRGLFERLARKFKTEKELITFLVSNIAYGNQGVVYTDGDSIEYYTTWIKRKESITRVFQQNLKIIIDHLEKEKIHPDRVYSCDNGEIPILLKLYLSGDIAIEVMAILQDWDGYLRLWESEISLWRDHFLVIDKVRPFVKYDSHKIMAVYQDFEDSLNELRVEREK